MKISIISFGQTGYYHEIAADLLDRIQKIYPFASTRCYSEIDLNNQIRQYAVRHRRGYGYWQWKPGIILQQLDSIEDGDILLYIDGRSHIPPKTKSLSWLDEFVDSEYDFAMTTSRENEAKYTTTKILEYFNVENNLQIINSNQYQSGLILTRKSEKSLMIFRFWNDSLINNSNLFSDDDNLDPLNLPGFIENRHDQSALSIILKIYSDLKIIDISNKLFESKQLLLQFKLHKRWYSMLLFKIRMILPEYVYNVLLRGALFVKYKLLSNCIKFKDYEPF